MKPQMSRIREHLKWALMIAEAAVIGVCLVALAYYGLLAARALVADQFIIPTNSMLPTLTPGDRVIVNKLVMGARIYTNFDFVDGGQELESFRLKGFRSLRHNDIAVFNFPINGSRIAFKINYVYCKRCVALPGDTLRIVNGRYVNNNFPGTLGVAAEQEKLSLSRDSMLMALPGWRTLPYDSVFNWTIKNMGPLYIPRKNDIIHIEEREALIYKRIIEYETGKDLEIDRVRHMAFLGGKPYTRHVFRNNYYFMAGDNVLDSRDSRYWGLVPEDYLVGVVDLISYSREYKYGPLRKKRFLKCLQ